MDLIRGLLVAALSLLGPGTPDHLEGDLPALLAAKTVKCTFTEPYAFTVWRSGRPRLTILTDGASRQNFVVEIDRKKQTARMLADGGAGNVQVWQTGTGIHLLETAQFGAVFLTSISGLQTKDGFVAVTSRHSDAGAFGIVGPQQYSGTCKVLE